MPHELAYWKDGKKIVCHGIYENGHEGQIVVSDNVSFGEKPDPKKWPLAFYPRPTIFTILKKTPNGYFLADQNGKEFLVPGEHCGEPSYGYLYDANEWAQWARAYHLEKIGRKDTKIEQLEAHLAMLKEILIKQGFRVITEAQAKELGL